MSSDSTSSDDDSADERDNGDVAGEDNDVILPSANRAEVVAGQKLVTNNPLWMFMQNCKGKVKGSADRGAVIDYLQSLFSLPHCFSKHSNRFEQCSCLYDIQENVVMDIIADCLSECYCC
jgi:hypothetical protein